MEQESNKPIDNVVDSNDKKEDMINLSEINWNKLSISEFHKLSKKFEERDLVLKSQKTRKKRDNGDLKTIRIDGVPYIVKASIVSKLKTMKSEKSKQKLLDNIRKNGEKVENI